MSIFMALLLKFIAFPLYPVGLTLILLSCGLIVTCFKKRFGVYLIGLALFILFFFSFPPVTRFLSWILEKDYIGSAELPRDCSAIVVLGGGGVSISYPRQYPEINEAGDRIIHGSRLYKMGVCNRIITTGRFVGQKNQSRTEASHNALLLREMGVDSADIIIEPLTQNTHEHGPYVARILDSLQLPRKVILVTSASHMYRSVAVFRKNGFEVYPAAADFNYEKVGFFKIINLLPSSYSLHRSTVNLHEIYGIIGYRILGWI